MDLVKLREYARIGATQIELAAVLGMSVATLERRLTSKKVREVLESAQSEGYVSLRATQFKVALAGNPTMLIWLGKQVLGQKDQHEFSGSIDTNVATGSTALERIDARISQLVERRRETGNSGSDSGA